MKQRYSYSYLLFHLVFRTKNGLPVFYTPEDDARLLSIFKHKAHELDGYIEEYGSWFDHVHLLARIRANLALSEFYRQLKGYSSRVWRLKELPNALRWADGVYSVSVNPYDCEDLRRYIQNQRHHHSTKNVMNKWETDDFLRQTLTSP